MSRRQAPLPLLRRLATPLLMLACTLLLAAGGYSWIVNRAGHGLSLHVEGRLRHMQPEELQRAAAPLLETGFFDVDIQAVHARILTLPWVQRAQLRRRWPDGVVVRVWEREPVARWGEASLITAQAEVYTPDKATLPDGLPRLQGPKDTERLLLQSLMHVTELLAPAGLRVAAVQIDERGAWSVVLDTGMTLRLGRQEIEERLRRFADITVPTLGDRLEQVANVDLRYSSGFAVSWRPGAEPPPSGEG